MQKKEFKIYNGDKEMLKKYMDTEKIIEIAKNKNGLVTSADVTTLGISRMVLKYLVEQGKLVKMARGVYALPSTMQDKYFDEQNRCHKGIYNSLSSLYLLIDCKVLQIIIYIFILLIILIFLFLV